MDYAKAFLANFASVADTPDGFHRIRDLIVDLAVSGRLSTQDHADQSADQLLSFIEEESLVATSSLTEQVPTEAGLWELPSNWQWARLKQVADFAAGRTPPTKDPSFWSSADGIPWVSIRDMPDGGKVTKTGRRVSTKAMAEIFKHDPLPPGTLLMSFKLTIGKVARLAVPAFHNEAIISIKAPFAAVDEYLFRVLPALTAGGKSKAAIMGDTLNRTSLTNLLIPVPPLAEQERIVAKMDELMRLCDELEARQHRHRRANARFRSSALHALTEAEPPDDLRQSWVRVSANWLSMTDDASGINDLRQAIVELAVTGRLTADQHDDESARKLVDRARADALDPPELVDAEGNGLVEPYSLPGTWCWVPLGAVLSRIHAGWSAPALQRPSTADEWGVLKVSACSWGVFRPGENKVLAPGVEPRLELEVQPGDFLISRANTGQLVARSVVVDTTPQRLMLSDKTLRLTPVDSCDPRYLNLANLARAARLHYEAEATGTSDSMKNVTQRAIRRTPIPLPPWPEQVRIVEQVDRLMSLCSELNSRMFARDAVRSTLNAALTRVG